MFKLKSRFWIALLLFVIILFIIKGTMGIRIEGMKVIDDLPPSKMSEIMSASTAAPATTAPTTATAAPATTQSSVVKGKELKYNAV